MFKKLHTATINRFFFWLKSFTCILSFKSMHYTPYLNIYQFLTYAYSAINITLISYLTCC